MKLKVLFSPAIFVLLAACAHLRSGEGTARRCAETAVSSAVAGINVDVATVLACDGRSLQDLPSCVEVGLKDLGTRAGVNALWCAVNAYAYPDGGAKPQLTSEEVLRQRRARAWKAAHGGSGAT